MPKWNRGTPVHSSLEDWAQWMRAVGSTDATVETRTKGIQSLLHHADIADPRQLQAGHVVAWLANQKSAWTRATYWSSAHMWFDFLTVHGVRDDDPMRRVPKPRQPRGVPRPVSERVVRKVLSDPPGHRAYSYTVLATYAGLRVHEIAKIRGEDVNWDTGWFFVLGKGNQEAWVPMHPLVKTLAQGMADVGFWFPGRHHGHVSPDTVSRVIRNAFKAVGSSATPHQCRHLFGSAVLRSCGNARVAQQLLRHESLSSTQIYTKVSGAEMEEAVNGLGWTA